MDCLIFGEGQKGAKGGGGGGGGARLSYILARDTLGFNSTPTSLWDTFSIYRLYFILSQKIRLDISFNLTEVPYFI